MILISSLPTFGSVGKDVITVQKQLLTRGFNPGAIDGIFGAKTRDAISNMQKANGLNGSGTIGPKTLQLLDLAVSAINPVTDKPAITRDLKGRQDRHLYPHKRLEIENLVFLNEIIPSCFVDRDPQACYALVMRKIGERGWRENGGNNYGTDVGEIQGTIGDFTAGGDGDAWCLDYGQMGIAFIEDYFQVESPVLGSAHCLTTFRAASRVAGLVSANCEAGTLALAQHGSSANGHAMPTIEILSAEQMLTSEGNTSISSIRDGDGSGLQTRDQFVNGNLKTLGWVRLYPNNKLPEA